MEWLAETFEEKVSQSITYRRGSRSVTLNASVGKFTQGYGVEFGGSSLQIDVLDFSILAADLIINGTTVDPAEGDLIDYRSRRYLVIQPDNSTPCSERDEYGLTLKIHAKFRAVI